MRGGITKAIINISLVFTASIFIFLTIVFIYMNTKPGFFQVLHQVESHPWWFLYKGAFDYKINPFQFAGILGLFTMSIIAPFILQFQFKKIASPELFFFLLFLSSFIFEGFRIISYMLYFFHVPVFFHLLISRIVYFGRFIGLLFLLLSSLYACEIKYQKYMNLAGVAMFISLMLAYLISLDSTHYLSDQLFKLEDEFGIFLIYALVSIFTIFNFVISAIQRHKRFFYISAACVLIMTGKEIIFFSQSIVPELLSLAFIVSGIVIFYREIDRIYLFF